ncbi:hypothetical protein ACHAXT_005890 [Thalassiosira profunda]
MASDAPAAASDDASTVASLTERLRFFFSDANLRQDKWMRNQLNDRGCLTLDDLLRFHTIKVISEDKGLLARAAKGEDGAEGEELQKLIAYNEEREEVSRVVPFDWKTMGDGSKLSLYVKNVPLTKEDDEAAQKQEEEAADGDGAEKREDAAATNKSPFKPRYAVTRDELRALFAPYGRVALVQLRYGRKHRAPSGEDEKYTSPNNRGYGRGESYPLGVAIVEFESEEGMEKACTALLPQKAEGDGDDEETKGPKTVLELQGNALVVEKMRPSRRFQNSGQKRSRDGDAEGGENEDAAAEEAKVEFEPVTLDWEKGCVIALTGLSTETCDRESLREAVSSTLGVSADVKTSGLYVDYNRGASTGNLRLKEPKPDEMKELVDKLTDGTVVVAGEKVGSAKILEGEEEAQYWKDFEGFLNNRKRMQEEERAQRRKRQKHGGGGRRGRGGRR